MTNWRRRRSSVAGQSGMPSGMGWQVRPAAWSRSATSGAWVGGPDTQLAKAQPLQAAPLEASELHWAPASRAPTSRWLGHNESWMFYQNVGCCLSLRKSSRVAVDEIRLLAHVVVFFVQCVCDRHRYLLWSLLAHVVVFLCNVCATLFFNNTRQRQDEVEYQPNTQVSLASIWLSIRKSNLQ